MKNQEIIEYLLTFLFLVLIVFGLIYIGQKSSEKTDSSEKSKVHFSLDNPDKSLQMVIRNLEEEYNIIVPIEDVEKVVIINLNSDKEKAE